MLTGPKTRLYLSSGRLRSEMCSNYVGKHVSTFKRNTYSASISVYDTFVFTLISYYINMINGVLNVTDFITIKN